MHNSFSTLTKRVSSKQGPLCRTLQSDGIWPLRSSLWRDSRPLEEGGHAPWSSCSQHSASVPTHTKRKSKEVQNIYKQTCKCDQKRRRSDRKVVCLDEQRFPSLGTHQSTTVWSQLTVWSAVSGVSTVLLIGSEGI